MDEISITWTSSWHYDCEQPKKMNMWL
jgi:hypothetical protein